MSWYLYITNEGADSPFTAREVGVLLGPRASRAELDSDAELLKAHLADERRMLAGFSCEFFTVFHEKDIDKVGVYESCSKWRGEEKKPKKGRKRVTSYLHKGDSKNRATGGDGGNTKSTRATASCSAARRA